MDSGYEDFSFQIREKIRKTDSDIEFRGMEEMSSRSNGSLMTHDLIYFMIE